MSSLTGRFFSSVFIVLLAQYIYYIHFCLKKGIARFRLTLGVSSL